MTLPACHVMYAILRIYLSAATTTHVKPTMYHYMTTSTTIVEKFPSITAHPVATEHAVPSTLPQGHLPLVIGKNQLLTTTILLLSLGMYVRTEFRLPLPYSPWKRAHGQCTLHICQRWKRHECSFKCFIHKRLCMFVYSEMNALKSTTTIVNSAEYSY